MSLHVETKKSPGKGLGIFAKHDIKPGTRIMYEVAALIFPPTPTTDPTAKGMQEFLDRQPQTIQDQFWALHEGTRGASRVLRVVSANSFSLSGGMQSYQPAIFMQIARVNHSCVPNADWVPRDDEKAMEVFANRPIKAGEEVFINYCVEVHNALNARRRNNLLRTNYGFTCRCSSCSAKGQLQSAGDMRREMIGNLHWSVDGYQTPDFTPWDDPEPCPVKRRLAMQVKKLNPPLSTKETIKRLLILALLYQQEGLSGHHVFLQYARAQHLTQQLIAQQLIANVYYTEMVEAWQAHVASALMWLSSCRPDDDQELQALRQHVKNIEDDVAVVTVREWRDAQKQVAHLQGRLSGFVFGDGTRIHAVHLDKDNWKLISTPTPEAEKIKMVASWKRKGTFLANIG